MKLPRALVLSALVVTAACGGADAGVTLKPVPAIRHAPRDVAGLTMYVRSEVEVHVEDPERLSNVRKTDAARTFREALLRALDAAGYRIATAPDRPHDLEGNILVEVKGIGPAARSFYHLRLSQEGKAIDEIVWEWPNTDYADVASVDDYAANHLVNALEDSRKLSEFARSAGAGSTNVAASGDNTAPSWPVAASPAASPPPGAFVAAAPQPAAYAVIVGIEHYRDLPAATGARADALRMASLAKTTLGLRDDHVHVALDDHATKTDIEAHLAWLTSSVPAGGRAYFYFSGHGAPDTQGGGDAYLVPYDGNASTVERSALPLARVLGGLSSSRAKEALAILDSCFSGAGGRSVIPAGARPLMRVKEEAPASQVALFTASASNEIAGASADGSGGLFTRWLTQGLGTGAADADGDGQISLQELGDWVRPRVTRDAQADHRAQTPTVTVGAGVGNAGNLVVAYGYAPH